jgi:hypothetical protein
MAKRPVVLGFEWVPAVRFVALIWRSSGCGLGSSLSGRTASRLLAGPRSAPGYNL